MDDRRNLTLTDGTELSFRFLQQNRGSDVYEVNLITGEWPKAEHLADCIDHGNYGAHYTETVWQNTRQLSIHTD